MKKELEFYTGLGFLLTALAGALLHFTYDLSGKSVWAGLFSPINESVWEHMKLTFFPLTAYLIFESLRLGRKIPALPSASAWGILAGTLSVPVIFYTYTGILGHHVLALDIATFLLALFLGFLAQRAVICQNAGPQKRNAFLPWGLVTLTGLCFFVFTFRPLPLPLYSSLFV